MSWISAVESACWPSCSRAGRSVVGVERSPRALEIARRRGRRHGRAVRFLAGDPLRLSLEPTRTAAVASADIVNHFPSEAELRAVFESARRCLFPGGTLAFDNLNRFCLERYWTDRTHYMRGHDGDLVMECDGDGDRRLGMARMIGYVRNGRGCFERVESVLHEYLHGASSIRRALQAAGLERIRREPWSPWPDQASEPSLDRDFWAARSSAKR